MRPTIMVAPNGARRTKADHPALPMTPDELAREAEACLAAGAAAIHLHVRDDAGAHVLSAARYDAAVSAVRRAVGDGLVIQITTEAVGRYSPAEQRQLVRDCAPEAVSMALAELLPEGSGPGAEAEFARFLSDVARMGTIPQIILYAPDQARRLAALIDRGIVPWPRSRLPVLYVLGRYAADQRSDPTDLLPFLDDAQPRFAHWTTCAFGPREAACTGAAMLLGGHARVGFENNLALPDGTRAATNADLVVAAAALARDAGLVPGTADDLRRWWQAG
ncbi:MAG: 3-keto-5-aminohexanoate cleavage protein [Rhodobacteraceae bacterium]|nr:3-keto-5-aminohexanoate cleavage protein [Paracoccaceae bacterium]